MATNTLINQQPAPTQIAIWDDDTIDLTGSKMRRDIPQMPTIEREFQVVKSRKMGALAYLMLQIQKTDDKEVVMRALASAVNVLFKLSRNFTGAKNEPVELTGLELPEKYNESDRLVTNFVDAEDVTIGEYLSVLEADEDEIGAYFGILFVAGNKRITDNNRVAFNERRRSAATASIIGEARIFVPDSPWLTDRILGKIYAAFLSLSPVRANMTYATVRLITPNLMGPSLAFSSMFLLLVDFGMNALRIVKEASIKHPWVRTEFPELLPEFHAANDGQKILRRLPEVERPFAKAIHGNQFVPVAYSQIDNLVGVCKEILRRSTPSYVNYGGGKITPAQELKINEKMGINQTEGSTQIISE